MTALIVIVGVFCAGAVVTFVGSRLIERAHRPRGRFVEIPRAVHTLHEDNPEAVLAALETFLAF